jgi:hypothetical protein
MVASNSGQNPTDPRKSSLNCRTFSRTLAMRGRRPRASVDDALERRPGRSSRHPSQLAGPAGAVSGPVATPPGSGESGVPLVLSVGESPSTTSAWSQDEPETWRDWWVVAPRAGKDAPQIGAAMRHIADEGVGPVVVGLWKQVDQPCAVWLASRTGLHLLERNAHRSRSSRWSADPRDRGAAGGGLRPTPTSTPADTELARIAATTARVSAFAWSSCPPRG